MFEGSHRLQKGKGLGTGTCPSTSCGSPPLEKSGGGNPSSFTSGFFKRNLSSSKQFPVLPFYIKIKSTEVKNSASRFSSDCKPRSILERKSGSGVLNRHQIVGSGPANASAIPIQKQILKLTNFVLY